MGNTWLEIAAFHWKSDFSTSQLALSSKDASGSFSTHQKRRLKSELQLRFWEEPRLESQDGRSLHRQRIKAGRYTVYWPRRLDFVSLN